MSGGKKFDGDKIRMDLIPTSLMTAVGTVLTSGAAKYGDRNWEEGIAWNRVYGAILRHLTSFWNGEDIDPESGKSHLWHAACELAFLIEFEKTHKELDNRPSNKKSPEVSPGAAQAEEIRFDNPVGYRFVLTSGHYDRPIDIFRHTMQGLQNIYPPPSIPDATGNAIDVEFTDVTDAQKDTYYYNRAKELERKVLFGESELVQDGHANCERPAVQSTSDDRRPSNPPLWDPVEVAQSNHKA